MTRAVLLVAAVVLLAGCGTRSLEAARHKSGAFGGAAEEDRDYCRKLDRRAGRQQAAAMGLGVVAGATAAGGAIPKLFEDEEKDDNGDAALIVTAVISAGAGAGAATLGYSSGRNAARWVQEGCGR